MSQKYYIEKNLKQISEDIAFYRDEFKKTGKQAEEIRYWFSVMKYYEIKLKRSNSHEYRGLYQQAKDNYERLVPRDDVFSMNHKA